MKRIVALILAALLLAGIGCAAADGQGQKAPDFILEGFDGEGTNRDWERNLFFTRMEEKTGISFEFREFTSFTKWQERKNAILEGENLPDVLFKAELGPGEIRDLYEAGILINLRPYMEEYAPDLWKLLQEKPEVLAAITLPDGAIAALPQLNALQNNDVMWINTSWLNQLKLEPPTDAESLTEVLRAFRDSARDRIPLTFISMWELRFLGHAFGIIDNDYYVSVKDGKVVSDLTSDRNREFLTWLHQLWEEKLIDHNGFSIADSMRAITDEKKPVPYGMIMSSTPLTVVQSGALGSFKVLAPLVYEGKQVYRDFAGEAVRGTFAITSRCADPAKLMAWVNYLYTEEGALMAQYGLEGVEYSFRDDGTWEWNEDLSTVANVTMPESTIGTGASAPGIQTTDFQLKFKDEETREDIRQLLEVRQYMVMPYPQVTLNREDEAEIARRHPALSAYAETAMARFVTGDVPLDDEQWGIFCRRVEELGLNEMIAIWQKYIE